ncbi:MAG TPA: PAS domain-containing protein [Mycobacteriales bacterium]|nr:PAS domain-containing protein [Mycobacteriales bacterium]
MRYIVVPILAPATAPAAAPATSGPAPDDDALGHWVAAARRSLDACLVVDIGGTVAALSPNAAELLGTAAGAVVGRSLDEVLHLVDFTEGAHEARGAERRIPPLIAVRENSLSRGMMRVRRPDGARLMLDAVAAPIHDNERNPVGAVSFLASV